MTNWVFKVCILQTFFLAIYAQFQGPILAPRPIDNEYIRQQQLRRFFESVKNQEQVNRPPQPVWLPLPDPSFEGQRQLRQEALSNDPPFLRQQQMSVPQLRVNMPQLNLANLRIKKKGCKKSGNRRPAKVAALAQAIAKAVEREAEMGNPGPIFRDNVSFNRGPPVSPPRNPFLVMKSNPMVVVSEGRQVGPELFQETAVIIEPAAIKNGPGNAEPLPGIVREINLKHEEKMMEQNFEDAKRTFDMFGKIMQSLFGLEVRDPLFEVEPTTAAAPTTTAETEKPRYHLMNEMDRSKKVDWITSFKLKMPIVREHNWRQVMLFVTAMLFGLLAAIVLLMALLKKKHTKRSEGKKYKKAFSEVSLIGDDNEGFQPVRVHAIPPKQSKY